MNDRNRLSDKLKVIEGELFRLRIVLDIPYPDVLREHELYFSSILHNTKHSGGSYVFEVDTYRRVSDGNTDAEHTKQLIIEDILSAHQFIAALQRLTVLRSAVPGEFDPFVTVENVEYEAANILDNAFLDMRTAVYGAITIPRYVVAVTEYMAERFVTDQWRVAPIVMNNELDDRDVQWFFVGSGNTKSFVDYNRSIFGGELSDSLFNNFIVGRMGSMFPVICLLTHDTDESDVNDVFSNGVHGWFENPMRKNHWAKMSHAMLSFLTDVISDDVVPNRPLIIKDIDAGDAKCE
jgi:hypothetical protein